MDKQVLITGASGLVGKMLCRRLLDLGYTVNALTRSPRSTRAHQAVRLFHWDVDAEKIDPAALDGVSAIIHLAGEPIASWPWTKKKKRTILDSRVKSIALLYQTIQQLNLDSIETVVSASATGYYPDSKDTLLSESTMPATGFLGCSCFLWELAVDKGSAFNLRTVSLRSGVILSNQGGIYAKLKKLVRMGVGTVLGSGKQWVPWIQVEDAVNAYIFALENQDMHGAYNLVAPQPIMFEQLMREIAKSVGKKIWLPNVPAAVLKVALGEMSDLVLCSHRVSAEKLQHAGFHFSYPTIDSAVDQLRSASN